MNCDDQVRLVKGDDNADADVSDLPGVSRSSGFVFIDEGGILDHLLHVIQSRSNAS